MTERSVQIKRIAQADATKQIDDKLAVVIEVYHKAETIVALFQASKSEKKISVKADFRKEFFATERNLHNAMKQVRAYQRRQSIFFSRDRSLTHYTLSTRKMKIERLDKVEKANHKKIFHLYDAKSSLSADDFALVVEFISKM